MASKIKLSNANGKIVTIENNDSNMSDVTLNGASITKKVDTLANIRAMKELPETVWCSGYHSKNDGAFGSHFYRLKGLKTTETDNSGTVIIVSVGSSDYVYELQCEGAVNVKWFGAVADCDSSTIVGDINYFNPSGTDNSAYFQNAIDVATLSNSNVYIPASELWYKIGEPLAVTCGVFGERTEGCKLKFVDDGTSIRTSFEINAVENAVFENFICDFSVSSDPTDWNGNYNNFTGRKGIRAINSGSNLVFKNINTYNSFAAGMALYAGVDTFIIDNVHINRTRGSFGDGFYLSGTSKKAKITNCSAYDFTRIGLVTDSPYGGIIEDCVVDNCSFEYGHHYSYLYGGTEFNAGVWLENTARSIIKNCTAKNTNGRGFTVTSGGDSLTIANYTECYSVIDSCVAEDTGAGFILGQLGAVNINHRVINCSAINCTVQDINGVTSNNTNAISNVYISNFYSEKSFVKGQARCLDFGAGTGGTINVVVNGFKVKSDFDYSTFTYTGNGHISEFSNLGTINYTIKDFKDTNGVVIDKNSGPRVGVVILENIDNIYGNHINCEDLIATNCIFNRYDADMSPVNTLKFYNCVFNSSFITITNTDIVFSNCEFNVPSDGNISISNNYASINEVNKVIVKFLNCNFYKDFTGTTKYAVQFSTKGAYKTGLYMSGCFFYNLATTGVGAYALYFNNGSSAFLGNNNYLDNTVEYTFTNYSTPQTSQAVIAKIALQ